MLVLISVTGAPGYSKDDGIRDNLLLLAIDIAVVLAYPNSDPCAVDPSMRRLGNNAKLVANDLNDIASDHESVLEG